MEEFLKVGESQIPQAGLGLFAKNSIDAGVIICQYRGDVISSTAEAMRIEDKSYLMKLQAGLYIDARKHEHILARFINDCRSEPLYNVRFQKKPEERCADVITTRRIQEGEEIFVDYGRWYWASTKANRLRPAIAASILQFIESQVEKEAKENKGEEASSIAAGAAD